MSGQRALLAIGCTFALAGCAGPMSTLAPEGPAAATIATLWWVMLIGATVIFLGTMGLFVAAFRATRYRGASVGIWIKGLGIAFPSVVLLALLSYGLMVGEALQALPARDGISIEATGRQWEWRFRHARAGAPPLESISVMHIPAGRPVDVLIRSDDVIHSFWVPVLAGKMDAIPGKTNRLRLLAPRPGRYAGQCAEFCGIGHTNNRFVVVAHDPASWARLMAPTP